MLLKFVSDLLQAFGFQNSQKKNNSSTANPLEEKIERTLHYSFKNKDLLKLALSHRSFVHSQKLNKIESSNERLEFLGDAVLSLFTTHYLYHRFPQSSEGTLSQTKSTIVSAKFLSRCSKNLNLGDSLYLSKSEDKSGGRERMNILADLFESLIGAIYLDSGYRAAEAFLNMAFVPHIDSALSDESLMNYKSKILEWSQANGLGTPIYALVEESGPDHQKLFKVSLALGENIYGYGLGSSKKEAEQEAARDVLSNLPSSESALNDSDA